MNRQARRVRPLLPFLLICLAGAATALLQATWLGLAIPPTGVLLLVVGNIFCVWGLWHWRHLMPLLPTPPWRRALRMLRRRDTSRTRYVAQAQWQLIGLRLRQMMTPPPPQPRPRRLAHSGSRLAAKRSRNKPTRTRPRLPLPSLEIEFVPPGRAMKLPASTYEIHDGVLALVQDALRQAEPSAPDVLALIDGPRQLTCQLPASPIRTGAQQRSVVAALQVHGFSAAWRDETLLNLNRDTVVVALPRANIRRFDALWVPVTRTRQGLAWWPIPRTQHLVLAGNPREPLVGCLQRLFALPEAHRPPILVHDSESRLLELDDALAGLPRRDDALAEARRIQLHSQYTEARSGHAARTPVPLLIVYGPDEESWSDLHPLLAAQSSIQVILVLGDRQPLSALRAVCHRLPVVEIPDPRFPPLPDAFRPGGLPPPRDGQALAWLPGGTTFWRGLPPAGATAASNPGEVG